jgi:hypothetical protein
MLGRIAVALAKSAWTYQDGRFNVAVPVNLRQRFEGPRSTGNLSNTVYFEVTKDSTPESVAKDLRKQLDNKNDCINIDRGFNMNLLPIWLIGLIVRIAARIVMRRGLFGAPIVVSNMGRMNLGNFCIDGFIADSIFPIPPMGEVAPAFVGIIGSGDKIDIVTSVPNMISDNGRLDKLVDDIRNIFI